MAAQFGAFIDVEPFESDSRRPIIPTAPQKAVTHTYHSVPQLPSELDLDSIHWGEQLNGPRSGAATPSGTQTPGTPADPDLEMRGYSTPHEEEVDGVEAMQSWSDPPINKFRMLSVSLTGMGGGLNDSAPGALIPYMEKHYDIGYAFVSMIFIANALGFILAAFFVDALRSRLGRARTLMLGHTIIICGYIPIICTPPFSVVVCCFFLLGFGMAINLSLGNVFAANLQNSTSMLGLMHGSYGLGGTIGPLIATAMVASSGFPWSRYYILTLGVALSNCTLAGWSFWNYEAQVHARSTLMANIGRTSSRMQNIEANRQTTSDVLREMLKAFKNKTVLLGALFIFAYQGAEVSISGWVISFLISFRNGDPKRVGYVTSGFWAGITLGRFLLSSPAHKVGEKLFVYFLVVGATAFQLLVWLVPNVVGDAVAVALVGLLLGPVYPCSAFVFTRAISHKEQVSGMSVISAFGSSGGAVAPFFTGILAQSVGTFVLHPICIGLFAVMLGCWYILPTSRKRTE